ncbi:NAD(P)/FAD-dependent oxidoreductase [Streptomyces montanisoli]|uniref:FAD-dependent oxidoreductase n=1 Tax=Streptomyces montanisoli TaxID=2798581 RepID=A0A940MA21_9ACTN|nr:NAD(P)/FAD-dependent oxidoreductase [Streptomyces montanisoli]MBP0457123.1 FAD-dependent oxidoreductase [Streptomyces montanisoli]
MATLPARCDVIVVGAGLAGLAAALELTGRGAEVTLLEAGTDVGGRVATDRKDGYLLDRGFQVLNVPYPEAQEVLDLPSLDLRPFTRALALHTNGARATLADPRRAPLALPRLIGAPIGTPRAKAALARYALRTSFLPVEGILHRHDVPAGRHWRAMGLADETVERLLRPFFTGLTLDPDATTSGRFVDLMLRMFVRGEVAVPADGMAALPRGLAARLPAGTVHLSTPVREVTAGSAVTESGTVGARAVIVATDADTAAGLLPGLPVPRWHGVTTWYHSTAVPPATGATLLVDADDSPVDNTIVISAAAPGYAPPGRALVATSTAHREDAPRGAAAEAVVRRRLAELYREPTRDWDLVATYDIPHALPAMTAPHPFTRPARAGDVFVCGDHRDTSSIQGALHSGRRVAHAVATTLGLGDPARTRPQKA